MYLLVHVKNEILIKNSKILFFDKKIIKIIFGENI